ncbi:MAG: hypothetical protein QOF98_64 [Streptomyces sp.]|nr:hypothetical protein [Streptomyces sp.]
MTEGRMTETRMTGSRMTGTRMTADPDDRGPGPSRCELIHFT